MTLEQVERKYYEALLDLSMGEMCTGIALDEAKARLTKYWLMLDDYKEWHGRALLLTTGAIAEQILDKHPNWGYIRKVKEK